MTDCAGHFGGCRKEGGPYGSETRTQNSSMAVFDPLPTSFSGYIRLELPVFHIGYFRNTVQILQCICKECSRVLLPDEERKMWLRYDVGVYLGL